MQLNDDFDYWGKDVLIFAIKRAKNIGVYNYKPIDNSFKNWRRMNLKTLNEIKLYDEKQKNKKSNNKKNSNYISENKDAEFIEVDEENLPF